mmetsp:Transcript_150709/g.482226  ORF Transcript_150709/g.482226 Transcript_150709/m.482226 type:complete len:89 (-) Transcript_150709:419-685(-)
MHFLTELPRSAWFLIGISNNNPAAIAPRALVCVLPLFLHNTHRHTWFSNHDEMAKVAQLDDILKSKRTTMTTTTAVHISIWRTLRVRL